MRPVLVRVASVMIVTEGGKNVYPEEIENAFQLYDEVEQVLICGYEIDKAMKSEGIEARLYPNHDFFFKDAPAAKMGATGGAAMEERMREVVEEVNQKLLSYQKITKVTVLSEPLEMTTTKKIKRFAVNKKN